MTALSEMIRFLGEMFMPPSLSLLTSSERCFKSMTIPAPMTQTTSSLKIPDGRRLRMNFPFSLMTV
ncbi:unknown [Acidaminococcus sp. CAG:917]|nr:unknown [Acidaminococcus sp. CAG:917]